MINSPDISVIILTYNQQTTVAQSIESILKQKTNYSFEIIIGEDASPDNTRVVCQGFVDKYPGIVRLIPEAPNKGLLKNAIDCLKACKGRYIAGCAGDDYWSDEQKMQKQVSFLDANPDYIVTHCEIISLDVLTGTMKENPIREDLPDGYIHEQLYKRAIVMAPTACYRSNFIKDIDFDKWIELDFKMDDIPLWLEASRRGKFHYMPIHTVVYRVAPESACHSKNIDKSIEFIESVYTCLYYYWDKFKPDFPRKDLHKLFADQFISISLNYRNFHYLLKSINKFGIFKVANVIVGKVLNKIK